MNKVASERRVLYLSLHQRHRGQGGDTHIGIVCDGLRDLGWSVLLVQPRATTSKRGPVALLRQMLGTQVTAMRRLAQVDIVYVRFHPLAVLLVGLARLLRTPVVIEVNGAHDDWFDIYPSLRRFEPVFRGLSRSQFRRAAKIISVCEGLARWSEDVAGVRVPGVVIPNAADPQRFYPVPSTSPPYVVYAGALTPWEGVQTALDATQEPAWPADLSLLIAGDGPLRQRVEAVAASSQRVKYVGLLPRHEVPQLVGAASIALSPFHKPPHGASPIKLYEAMACGVPVAVSDSPGQYELVRSTGCGVVFSADRPDQLAAAVAKIADDEVAAAEMGRRGRQAVLNSHSWEHRLCELNGLLTSVAEGRLASSAKGSGQAHDSTS